MTKVEKKITIANRIVESLFSSKGVTVYREDIYDRSNIFICKDDELLCWVDQEDMTVQLPEDLPER